MSYLEMSKKVIEKKKNKGESVRECEISEISEISTPAVHRVSSTQLTIGHLRNSRPVRASRTSSPDGGSSGWTVTVSATRL